MRALFLPPLSPHLTLHSSQRHMISLKTYSLTETSFPFLSSLCSHRS